MSTKKNGYVRRINCTCYKELSQSLKIKYFMAVDENVARSCELFPFFLSLFLWKGYSATLVIRWYACRLQGNLDRKPGNLARKYFESKALLKKGINFFGSAKRTNVLRLWDARTRFTMSESLFTRLYDQKIAGQCIEIFLHGRQPWIKRKANLVRKRLKTIVLLKEVLNLLRSAKPVNSLKFLERFTMSKSFFTWFYGQIIAW